MSPLFLFFSSCTSPQSPLSLPLQNPSMCLAGMTQQWQEAGCTKIQKKELEEGYIRFQCASGALGQPTNQKQYHAILWLEGRKQYAKPLTDDVVAICGDPHTILVEATTERQNP